MRVLGLDLGSRRIGLAVSDPDGRVALPLGALERRGLARDLQALCTLIGERRIERAVVGLPLHMTGRGGSQAEAARRFAVQLAEAAGIPVDTLDERWTTREARRVLRASSRTGGLAHSARRRGRVDAVAAALLLETYLARLRGAHPDAAPPGEKR